MAKAYELDPYKYIAYILNHRPSHDMLDDELELYAPWNENVKIKCSNT